MPIHRASFPEGYPIGPPEELINIEEYPKLLNAISGEALPLERGEYDLTPPTLNNICKFYLFVHNEDRASFMAEPQCEDTGLEGHNAIIANSAEAEEMKMIAVHDESNLSGHLFEVIFYSKNLVL